MLCQTKQICLIFFFPTLYLFPTLPSKPNHFISFFLPSYCILLSHCFFHSFFLIVFCFALFLSHCFLHSYCFFLYFFLSPCLSFSIVFPSLFSRSITNFGIPRVPPCHAATNIFQFTSHQDFSALKR